MPARRRGAGRHDSRSEFPDAPRAHARRDPARLSRARARPRAPRRPRHRRLAVHRRRGRAAARRASRSHFGLPAGRARVGAARRSSRQATATCCSSARSSRERTSARCSTRTNGSSARGKRLPPLVLAGKATEQSGPWLERIARAAARRTACDTSATSTRRTGATLYEGARLLVQPSFEEGLRPAGARSDDGRRAGRRRQSRRAARGARRRGRARRPRGRRRASPRRSNGCSTIRPRRASDAAKGLARARLFTLGADGRDDARRLSGGRRASGRATRSGLTCGSASTRASSAATATGVGRYLGGLLQRVGRRRSGAPPRVRALRARAARRHARRPPVRHARGRGARRHALGTAATAARRRARPSRRLLRARLHRAALRARSAGRRHPRRVVCRASRMVHARAKGFGAGC